MKQYVVYCKNYAYGLHMLFGSRTLNKEVNIKMQNVNTERERVTKFLGVFTDELLNWKAQIQYVQAKLSKKNLYNV